MEKGSGFEPLRREVSYHSYYNHTQSLTQTKFNIIDQFLNERQSMGREELHSSRIWIPY